MPRCIVHGCPHYSGRKNSTPGVTFHMFPKNLATIKKWLLQINQNFGDVDSFAQGILEGKSGVIRICSAHFAIECYRFVGSQKILLEDAVPTMFLGKVESAGFSEKQKALEKIKNAICPMVFVEKHKASEKIENSIHSMSFLEKQKTLEKMENTICPMEKPKAAEKMNTNYPMVFVEKQKASEKMENTICPMEKSKVAEKMNTNYPMVFVEKYKASEKMENSIHSMSFLEKQKESDKMVNTICPVEKPKVAEKMNANYPMVFVEKYKASEKMENSIHSMSFLEKQKESDKMVNTICPVEKPKAAEKMNANYTMVFLEKQKASEKMESDVHLMIFPEKEKMAVKMEDAIPPMMFADHENTAVKVEAIRPLRPSIIKGTTAAGSIPDTEKPHLPQYWSMQSLPMPSLPFFQRDMANSLCANNGHGPTNINSCSADTLASFGANRAKHEVDNSSAKSEPAGTGSHVTSADNVPDMQEAERQTKCSERDVGVPVCPRSLLSPTVQREDKEVQWPEQEPGGLAWKVLHDHYYKVRKAINRSARRNGMESSYKDMDSEGELLAVLQYVTGVLWRNRRKKQLKTARILNQILEIITLITGEEWVIVKKDSIHKGIHELTGEVPVKCGNVAVFFTLDEWSYIEKHRQKYAEMVADSGPVHRTWQVQEHWDSAEEYLSEEEEEVVGSPKRTSSPEWNPGCDSLDSVEEEINDSNRPKTAENGVRGEPVPHMSRRAPEGEGEDCEACGERLTSKEDLIRHKAVSHAAKRYPCPICGIQYDYKSQFIIHQRAHTGEKPFVCQECGARFGHKSSYLVHERRHKDGKTFECDKCDRRFDKKCELVKHEKAHGQKKRHKCHKCGKRYLSRSALMRHKWAHKDE